jgi:hypothetical protein
MNIIITHKSQKIVDIHIWYSLMFTIFFAKGWKSFKVYHTRQKGLSPYFNPILPYILIPIKIMNPKLLKFLEGLYIKQLKF